jgi:hypothetical protein
MYKKDKDGDIIKVLHIQFANKPLAGARIT